MFLLDAYAHYLFQREVAILMTFRRQGRIRRLLLPAYWRATLLPLAFFVGYGVAFFLPVPQTTALLAGLFVLLGVFAGELIVFQQSKLAWPVFERVLQWEKVADYHQRVMGRLPALDNKNKRMRDSGRPVPQEMRQMILKGYLTARRHPPSFAGWIQQAPELRMTGLLLLIVLIFGTTQSVFGSLGLWLLVPMFFLGIQLRRIKMALDFIVTWPLMEQYVDWQSVYRDIGTVEKVEF